ncbi:DUF2635 domain-containing protein [Vibrio sp. Y2-5]|uniref:DUF2635 domain-containing protein n=1 Tax=Vibrio sp. Y2-5 TaxID=2743977 RepID=UPI001661224E|nr:DUF2635 domain-containing protein [Vibrio sp. Y2-5]MBD0786416.1 DUF2635 domain-containing protein [Vibrio sp. Y2-5]
MATIKIKPLNGLIVRDPETREPLKVEGEEKPRNPYWLRRLKEKSVELVGTNVTKTAKKTVATKEADQ